LVAGLLAGVLLTLLSSGPAMASRGPQSGHYRLGRLEVKHFLISRARVRASQASAPLLTMRSSGGVFGEPWRPSPSPAGRQVFSGIFDGAAGASLITSPLSGGPVGSQASDLYVGASDAHAGWSARTNQWVTGQNTWYHVGMEFPSRSYAPTTGDWNWLVEWHNDDHTAAQSTSPVSIALGVYTDYPVVTGQVGRNPHLVLRLAGGQSSAPFYKDVSVPNGLLYDHWYSLTFHFVWSPDPSVGYVEWFLDGRRVSQEHFATLFTNTDGTHSYNTFGVYNYHLSAPWTSIVDFNRIAIGGSRASVGG
jgi:hypothetical protein